MTRSTTIRFPIYYRRRYSLIGMLAFCLFIVPAMAIWYMLVGLVLAPGAVALAIAAFGTAGDLVLRAIPGYRRHRGMTPLVWTGALDRWGRRYMVQLLGSRRTDREPTVPELSDELVRLATLRQAGVLSDAEFDIAKARTLKG